MTANPRRLVGATVSALAAVVWSGAVAVGPATAAPLGAMTLSSTSGVVTATPIFASATTDRPCPAGYGSDVQLRVGRPGGPYTNLARPQSAGRYDKANVTVNPNRSFATALGGGNPIDGEWWVVLECISRTAGVHPERFVTPITVSGSRWRTGRPAGAPPITADPSPGAALPGNLPPTAGPAGPAVASAPAGGAGDPAAPTGGAAADPTASASPHLAGRSRTGSASLGGAAWLLGIVAIIIVVGTAHLLTRRRAATAGPASRRAGASRRGSAGASRVSSPGAKPRSAASKPAASSGPAKPSSAKAPSAKPAPGTGATSRPAPATDGDRPPS